MKNKLYFHLAWLLFTALIGFAAIAGMRAAERLFQPPPYRAFVCFADDLDASLDCRRVADLIKNQKP